MTRNKRTVRYRKCTGSVEVTTLTGSYTGEFGTEYTEPEEIQAVVAPPTGEVYRDMFGLLDTYDCILTVDDPHCPISEEDVVLLARYAGGSEAEYIVKRCAPTLNSCSYALTQVSRS